MRIDLVIIILTRMSTHFIIQRSRLGEGMAMRIQAKIKFENT